MIDEKKTNASADKRKRRLSVLLTAVCAVIVCVAALVVTSVSEREQIKESKSEATVPSELVSLAERDPAEIEKIIKVNQIEKMVQNIEKSADEGGKDIWSMFNSYVILGDSRALGFSYYRFLRSDRVFASGGNSIRNIPEHFDELKAISPSYIFLCYGLNDTGVGYWKTGDEYAEELRQVFTQLHELLPDTMIIASSILPATDAALERSPVWRKIPDFDRALKQVCEEKDVVYVDNSDLVDKYMSTMWNPDGVHLHEEFYPLWAKNLIIAMLTEEMK